MLPIVEGFPRKKLLPPIIGIFMLTSSLIAEDEVAVGLGSDVTELLAKVLENP